MKEEHVKPIEGAASYFAAYEQQSGKPYVWMQVPGEDFASIIEPAKTIESARAKALRWQKKENAAVKKSAKK